MSRTSIKKYLDEIEAIEPALVSGKSALPFYRSKNLLALAMGSVN